MLARCEKRHFDQPHQLPALILMVLASACSALGIITRSAPFVRLASICRPRHRRAGSSEIDLMRLAAASARCMARA